LFSVGFCGVMHYSAPGQHTSQSHNSHFNQRLYSQTPEREKGTETNAHTERITHARMPNHTHKGTHAHMPAHTTRSESLQDFQKSNATCSISQSFKSHYLCIVNVGSAFIYVLPVTWSCMANDPETQGKHKA
jgi:hypothetical protein